tara:strand:+ start:276 stop:458 length:183 start_codon:yes stop_codon:yes gene_type:complete
MSHATNDTILENLYDQVWEEYRVKNDLTLDQMYHLEQDDKSGIMSMLGDQATTLFEDLAQ